MTELLLTEFQNVQSLANVLKQACYAGTFGLMQARDYVTLHPEKRVLVIAADIARYGLGTTGESSQGCGAVAMVLSADPRIAVIEKHSGFVEISNNSGGGAKVVMLLPEVKEYE